MKVPTMMRGEVWRVSRHWVSRMFVGGMLIMVASLMIFQAFTHNQDVDAALHQATLERDRVSASELMGDRPTELPVSAFYQEPRYFWAFDARNDVQATAVVATVLAFMWGVILSGSGWVTGTNRHVFTWEPRRAQLLAIRAVVVAGYASLAYLAVAAVTLTSSVAIAATRGSFASVSQELVLSIFGTTVRAAVAVALLALIGSALADLFRSPIPPLVMMAGYLVLLEPAARAAFPNVSNRLVTSLLIEWIRGRFLEGETVTIDCGMMHCPEVLLFATLPGPGLALGTLGTLIVAVMWLATEHRDVPA